MRLTGTIMLLILTWAQAASGHEIHHSYPEMANSFLADGMEEAALACINRAIELEPDAVPNYQWRAFFFLKKGLPELALNDFGRVIELAPRYAEGYLSRGLVLSSLGARERSDADFRKACDLGDASGCAFLKESASTR